MTSYILKLIAITTMTIDHSSYLIYHGHLSWMNYIGRIAFPIFAFQISEGYVHTRNLKKYFSRLLLFALIAEIPYAWFSYTFFSGIKLNIIFTLILGLLAIHIYNLLVQRGKASQTASIKKDKNIMFSYKLLGIIVAILLALFADKFGFDYGFYGVFLIFIFYILRNNKILRNIIIVILTLIYYLPYLLASNFNISIIVLFIFSIVPLILINLYNGQKGKDFKMLFYIFYPSHLLILCLISQLIKILA